MPRYREETYNLLSSQDDDGELGGNGKGIDSSPHSKGLSRGIIFALVAFVMADILAYVYIAKVLLWLPIPNNPKEMEFRDPYYGLDELYRLTNTTTSKYPRILNMPKFSAQISRTEPNKVARIDPHRWLSDYGLLSPPDRRLQVSRTIHTVAQFSVLDYGMEKCSIAARLPARDATLPHPFSFRDSEGVIRLDICELDTKRPIDQRTVSWNTRPKCVRSVGTLEARIGEEIELPSFPCKSGEFFAYEVSCAAETPDCGVDVWSNQNQTWGMFMYQYQTV